MLAKTLNKDKILTILKDHSEEISEYGVARLGLFGSYVRGEQQEDSDIDILVEYQEGKKSFRNFMHLAFLLEDILGEKVDLSTWPSISDRLRSRIEQEIKYVTIDA